MTFVGPTATCMSGGVRSLAPNERASQPAPMTGDPLVTGSRIARRTTSGLSCNSSGGKLTASRTGIIPATGVASRDLGEEGAVALAEPPATIGTASSVTTVRARTVIRPGIPATNPPPKRLTVVPYLKGPYEMWIREEEIVIALDPMGRAPGRPNPFPFRCGRTHSRLRSFRH